MPSGWAYPLADTWSYGKSVERNGSVVEELAVEDLVDLSDDGKEGSLGELYHSVRCSTTNSQLTEKTSSYSFSPVEEGKSQVLSSLEDDDPPYLCVPPDDLADLEWFCNGAEESYLYAEDVATTAFGSGSDTTVSKNENQNNEQFRSPRRVPAVERGACSAEKQAGSFLQKEAIKPGRARSKRSRTGVRFWNTRILFTDVPTTTLESCSTFTVKRAVVPPLSDERDAGAESMLTKKLCKATKNHQSKRKKPQEASQLRRCLHCAIQKTPQWRAGPMGPKTLCNACGVRYRSGRLLPEYRPAASPTFVETIHSNSHRRVLDLHRQRVSQVVMRSHETQLQRQQQMQIHLGYGDLDDCLLLKEIADDSANDSLGIIVT